MAITPQPAFTTDAATTVTFNSAASNVALPGTPASDTVLRLVNLGSTPAYVKLGSSSVTVTPQTGVAILPGPVPVFLGINGATNLAGVTTNTGLDAGWAGAAIINLATGN
jgi:hypothetical protein